MIPWEKIDAARIPGTGDELRLMRRGREFSIKLGTNELMNSRLSGSEAALATLAAERVEKVARPRVLIGGLGMGFTLRAALAAFGSGAQIVVAELVPAVVSWARGPMAEIFGDCLNDPRVSIREVDVAQEIERHPQTFDAILLDVDNGPEGLTRRANDALYDAAGLRIAYAAMRRGGVLAVWSSGPSAKFSSRLRRAGFVVNEVAVRATGRGGGARHVIWIAIKEPTLLSPPPDARVRRSRR
ncbi:spermidine synthase [Bradyrhizobium jicamae]|uniref:Spermidine synthase n=1 Tax=Bradyrhizobium jicamae TaxID=280332 RepID=A0ABS5FD75_9BRAD|nr:spermidine synthase [Bradyrhizobium jicamae]MBR0794733.1 spermidine synthase [Bradyrhizobium jicamae]